MNEKLQQVLDLIDEGAADDRDDQALVYDAIKARAKTVRARKARLFQIGDKVVFLDSVRPHHLRKKKAVVDESFVRGRVTIPVLMDEGQWKGRIVNAHADGIKKVEA